MQALQENEANHKAEAIEKHLLALDGLLNKSKANFREDAFLDRLETAFNESKESPVLFAVLLMARIRQWRNVNFQYNTHKNFLDLEKNQGFKLFLGKLLTDLQEQNNETEDLRLAKVGFRFICERVIPEGSNEWTIDEKFYEKPNWEQEALDHLKNHQTPFFKLDFIKSFSKLFDTFPAQLQLDFWHLMSSWLDQQQANTEAFRFALYAFARDSDYIDARLFIAKEIKALVANQKSYDPLFVYQDRGTLRLETTYHYETDLKSKKTDPKAHFEKICKAFVSFVVHPQALIPSKTQLSDFFTILPRAEPTGENLVVCPNGATVDQYSRMIEVLLAQLETKEQAKIFIDKIFDSLKESHCSAQRLAKISGYC